MHDAAAHFVNATSKIKEFRSSLDGVITSARNLRCDVEALVKEHELTLEDISASLSKELDIVFETIKSEFSEPPPEDQDERYKYRARKIASALSQVRAVFMRASSSWGMPEQEAEIWFDNVEPQLSKVLNITGTLQSPQYIPTWSHKLLRITDWPASQHYECNACRRSCVHNSGGLDIASNI